MRVPPELIDTAGAAPGDALVYDNATDSYAPGGGGSLTVQDENGNVGTGVTQIDFQGAGVTAAAGTGEVVVTIPGGGGGSGRTLLGSTTLTVASASITVSGIAAGHKDLLVRARLRNSGASARYAALRMGATSVDTGNNYSSRTLTIDSSSGGPSALNDLGTNALYLRSATTGSTDNASDFAIVEFLIVDYTNTSYYREVVASSSAYACRGSGRWANTTAVPDIISILNFTAGETWNVNSKVEVYGID